MNRLIAFTGALLAVLAVQAAPAALAQDAEPPAPVPAMPRPISPDREVRLFNGNDLTGWYTFFPSRGVNSDPDRVVTIQDGTIRISGQEFGYVATVNSYANYHLTFEVKWGEKRWPPREDAVRDSGCLVHGTGPDAVWMKSFECQIQERDFGDIYHIGGISSVVNGKRENDRVIRTANHEKPHGRWNTVEVICDGDRITNVVNGAVVNVATGVTRGRDGTGGRLNFGKILFQSEGAEVYYRNIVLRPIQYAPPPPPAPAAEAPKRHMVYISLPFISFCFSWGGTPSDKQAASGGTAPSPPGP